MVMMRFSVMLLLGSMMAASNMKVTPGCVAGSAACGFGFVFLGSWAALETSRSNNPPMAGATTTTLSAASMAGAFGSAPVSATTTLAQAKLISTNIMKDTSTCQNTPASLYCHAGEARGTLKSFCTNHHCFLFDYNEGHCDTSSNNRGACRVIRRSGDLQCLYTTNHYTTLNEC